MDFHKYTFITINHFGILAIGLTYRAIRWNRSKKHYDRNLGIAISLVLVVFFGLQLMLNPEITKETLIIRSSGFVAILLLHFILMIGPMSRLDTRFLPLLYNRRHLGVVMFFFALLHGSLSIFHFHGLGDTNPIISVFTSNQKYLEISEFPFQVLGLVALCIFFVLAVSSHDFWLKQLSPKFWKALHMSIYFAYGLVIAHVALGALQYEDHPGCWLLLVAGFLIICGLHLWTGFQGYRSRGEENRLESAGYFNACHVDEIAANRAKICHIDGQSIAIFKYNEQVSAVSNACKHQLGPLGEGKIIDGCITCPWHGRQYLPSNGQSVLRANEKITTYPIEVREGSVWVSLDPGAGNSHFESAKISP